MERYDNFNLELECEEGGVSQKAALFGGMFKKSSKSAETQGRLSVNNELSKSNDSLTESSNKEKGSVLKGVFKKATKGAKDSQPQDSLSLQNPELSVSSDNLTDKSSKEKTGMFGGILKRSPKPGHVRRPSQDLLDNEFTASNDSLSDNTTSKESGGMFSGMFKKASKPFGARTQSQDDLSAGSELSGSTDNLAVSNNTKESGGIFGGMFKKSPKPFGARAQSHDDLSAENELSGSTNNLVENNNTKEKGGILSGVFKKKVAKSQSQDDLSVDAELSASSDSLAEKPSKAKEKAEHPGDSTENNSSTDKAKPKQNGFSAMMKSTFYSDKQEKNSDSDCEEMLDNGDSQSNPKQKLAEAMTKLNPFRSGNKHEKQAVSDDDEASTTSEKPSSHKQNAVVGAVNKLNPFRSAAKKDAEDTETRKDDEKKVEEKPKVVKSNMIQREKKDRSETPTVPPRPSEEEMKSTSAHDRVRPKGTEDAQEVNRAATRAQQKPKSRHQNASDEETLKNDESAEAKDGDEVSASERSKVRKHKHHNPFMPRSAAKASSDDEGLKDEDDSSSTEQNKDEEDKEETKTKVKKPKRHNPFMPRVKAKAVQKPAEDGAVGGTAENDRSLFDKLEDFRIDPSQPESGQDVEDLMEWWNTVEGWEETPQDEDMTEKEEAKAFAVTADKVQKGIRVFNKLFSERAESLWQHVIDLNGIADGLDKFSKNTKIAQITGGSTSAIGGVATIAGLALAPVTFGTSLIVTAVGLGVATAGGLTSAGAGISNQVNNSMDRKKVEKIVQDYQDKMVDLNKCLKFIKQGIENLKRFDLIKMKNNAYNRDFPVLSTSFYEDGAMAGKAILINANEIMRVVQIANVAGSTAARAVQIASMATGVLTGLFVGMDIYFVAKDSKELKKGAKSEFAAKIREVATQLHDGLVELNSIREELQSASPQQPEAEDGTPAVDNEKKEKNEYKDDSSEDEIDRIKKAIKKDMENREYV
ncbi:uncharacterized protein V6R79_026119 [Siganus canaliculatus]